MIRVTMLIPKLTDYANHKIYSFLEENEPLLDLEDMGIESNTEETPQLELTDDDYVYIEVPSYIDGGEVLYMHGIHGKEGTSIHFKNKEVITVKNSVESLADKIK